MDCPVCLCGQCTLVESQQEFKLYHCLSCDLQFWHPMKSPGKEWYESQYFWRPMFREKLEWYHKQFLNDKIAPGSRVLDVGCGSGTFATAAAKKSYHVTGVDLDKGSVKAGRATGVDNLHAATLEEFISENPEKQFNIVTFFEVLEHLDNPTSFLAGVKSVLTPGGIIAFSVPNRGKWRLLPSILDNPPNHLTRWSKLALSNLVRSIGFSVKELREKPITLHEARIFLSSQFSSAYSIRERISVKSKEVIQKGSRKDKILLKLYSSLFVFGWKTFFFAPSLILSMILNLLGKRGYTIYVLAQLRDDPTPNTYNQPPIT